MKRVLVASALGFTIKSGWACAVVVDGTAKVPALVSASRIELSDPADARSRQPYHASTGTARTSGRELDTLIRSVERFGRRSVDDFLRQHEQAGRRITGAGIVVGSLIDPATIANDHIRIHALEGRLFRGIVIDAVEERGVASSVWRERDLYEIAAKQLKRSDAAIRDAIAKLGRARQGAWRAEHKAAALAAWLVLNE